MGYLQQQLRHWETPDTLKLPTQEAVESVTVCLTHADSSH